MAGEKHVLVRAVVSADGLSVRVAPGVEIAAASVDVVGDVPALPTDAVFVVAIAFQNRAEREEYAAEFNAMMQAQAA